jgi:hypothetical protein
MTTFFCFFSIRKLRALAYYIQKLNTSILTFKETYKYLLINMNFYHFELHRND